MRLLAATFWAFTLLLVIEAVSPAPVEASVLKAQLDTSATPSLTPGDRYTVEQHIHNASDPDWSVKRIILHFDPSYTDYLTASDCKVLDLSFPYSGGPWNGTQQNISWSDGTWPNVNVEADDATKTCTYTSRDGINPLATFSAGSDYDMVFSSHGSSGDLVRTVGALTSATLHNFGYFHYSSEGAHLYTVEPDTQMGSAFFMLCDDTTCTANATSTQASLPNVLFLPGIEGSRLYRPDYDGGTDKLWEPDALSSDIPDLYSAQSGAPLRDDIYVKAGDIIESIPTQGNVYGDLEHDLDSLKQEGKIGDWEAIPYDWRLPIDEILTKGNDIDGRIYYAGPNAATSTPYLIQELRRLAAGGHKVTIIAHSNGGLIAKRLTQLLGEQEAAQLIDKIILVASPQAGAPQAVASALHGDDQSLAFGLLLTKNGARTFASTTPMTYNLLPSASYFTQVDDPVVTFDQGLPDWAARYGQTIHSQELLDGFLKDSYGRVDAKTGDIDQPIRLDIGNTLVAQANQMHATLDTWTAPAGIKVIQIAGWGIPTTISGINYVKKDSGVEPIPMTTVDGDGTVPVPSALWMNGSGVQNYWLDLGTFNTDHPFLTLGNRIPRKHGTIFDIPSLREFISDTVTDSRNNPAYVYVSTKAPLSDSTKRLRYTLHSPLTLDLYDASGRHAGISTTTGQIEENIPNSYYLQLGDVKYVYTDENTPVHVKLQGYNTGTFTFGVSELQANTVVASTTFKDLPVSPQTSASIDVGNTLDSVSPLRIDKNGDGIADLVLIPKLNDTVGIVPDTIPPEARIGFDWGLKSVVISRIDDVAPTTTMRLVNLATSTKLIDDSGNSLQLTFSKNEQKKDHAFLSFATLKYDSQPATSSPGMLRYYWSVNLKSGAPVIFLSLLKTKQAALVSLYIASYNKTFVFLAIPADETADPLQLATSLMVKPRPVLKQYPGFVIPYMATQTGKLNIGY